MKIRLILLIFFYLLGLSCQDIQPRKPINNSMSVFLKNSAERNKSRVKAEQNLINKARKLDTINSYSVSNLGFLFSIENKKSKRVLAKRGDTVEIQYKIEDLYRNLLYDEDEIQIFKFIVDKEEVIPGLREGVKFLSEGETGVFLFPSHFCYGYQGDFEKIGPNQPLRFTIKLVSLSYN